MMRVEAAAASSSSSKNFIDKENETQGQNKDKQVRTFYTFKPGETVEMLSEYVGVDVEALKALNPGVDLDFVFPGDRVVVHVERQREREQKKTPPPVNSAAECQQSAALFTGGGVSRSQWAARRGWSCIGASWWWPDRLADNGSHWY